MVDINIETSQAEILSSTSSIGPQWPPAKASFERIKGFYNIGIIESKLELLGLLDETQKIGKQLDLLEDVSRVSIRAVVKDNLLADNHDLLTDHGEAIVSLDGDQSAFTGTSILYLGYNKNERQSHPDDLDVCFKNLRIALNKPLRSASEAIGIIENKGYCVGVLDYDERTQNESILCQVASLYRRFGWEKDDVDELLRNRNNLIAVAKDKDVIIGAGIAEMSLINIGGNNGLPHSLRMVELTEAATEERYAGQGLYSAVSGSLLIKLYLLSKKRQILGGSVDLIFGECNGSNTGILCVAKSQGRIFAYEDSLKRGLPLKGVLLQHVPIAGDGNRRTRYNDLFPLAMTSVGLDRFVQL